MSYDHDGQDAGDCTCYPYSTILCDWCTDHLCDRCEEPPDLCDCPTDGAPQDQWEVTDVFRVPEQDTRDEHDWSL